MNYAHPKGQSCEAPSIEGMKNPAVNLDPAVSGEYHAWLKGLVRGLELAIEQNSVDAVFVHSFVSTVRQLPNAQALSTVMHLLPTEVVQEAYRTAHENMPPTRHAHADISLGLLSFAKR